MNKTRASNYSQQTLKTQSNLTIGRSKIYKISEKEGSNLAKRMFNNYDRDRSGRLDGDQISRIIKDAYKGIFPDFQPSEDDIKSFVKIHDKNGDGAISLEDWEKTVQRYLCFDEYSGGSIGTQSPRTMSKASKII